MAALNQVTLIGNLTRDPEVRHTPTGTAIGDLGLAISEKYKTKDGSEKEETVFVDIVVWGKSAEHCKEYLSKGSQICVQGKLQLDQWESQSGEKKSKIRVKAERVHFIGGRQGAASGSRESTPRQQAPKREESKAPDLDDEVPF